MQPALISPDPIIISFFDTCIPAGFPSPAQDYMEEDIDLQKLLVDHPLATFLVRVKGKSMINAFIPEDALLVVDKSLKPKHNDIIVGLINGEFTVKYLIKKGSEIILQPANPAFKPITVTEEMNFTVWGVVSKIIIDPKKVKQ
jgi:DNA polymerase V